MVEERFNSQPEGQSDPGSDPEALKQALTEQKQKAETYLANWQRAGADLANFKKKTDQERKDTVTYANAMLVAGLLPVLDDLERALQTVDARLAGLTWVEGIRHIYRKLAATLEAEMAEITGGVVSASTVVVNVLSADVVNRPPAFLDFTL